MEQESLATELLHIVKMNARRWFIAFLVMVAVEICTVVGFIWYMTLPVETEQAEYNQEIEDVDKSTIHQIIGDDNNGESKADNQKDLQEKSSQE